MRGTSALLPVPFSIPPQGSRPFPNMLASFGPITAPAILAVESSDGVRLSSIPLRVAYADRPLTVPVRFNPSAPGTGMLILGILDGLVRVNIYDHSTGGTLLATRLFSSSGEQVTRLRYADLLAAGMAIGDGVAIVTPLSGQAVGVSVNAPDPATRGRCRSHSAARAFHHGRPRMRVCNGCPCQRSSHGWRDLPVDALQRHGAGEWSHPPSILPSEALGTARSFSTWLSRHRQAPSRRIFGSTAGRCMRAAPPRPLRSGRMQRSAGRSPVGLPRVKPSPVQTSEPCLWMHPPRATTITPTTAGSKSYALSAVNPCGRGEATGGYEILAACRPPSISSFTIDQSTVCPGASSTMRFAIAEGTAWTLQSALGNGLGPPSGSGAGSLTSVYIADSTAGNDVVTLTASGACGTPATRTLNLTVPAPPVITSFTAPASVGPGASGTITFAYTGGTS